MVRSARPWIVAIPVLLIVAGCGGATVPSASPTAKPTLSAIATATAASPTPAAPIQLTTRHLDTALVPGTYRVDAPFGAAFSLALPTEWTLKALSKGDVEFVDSGRGDRGTAWLVVDLVENVFADPCHDAGPRRPPVPKILTDVVEALTRMPGYQAGPMTDVTIGGHRGKALEIANTIDTETAGCVGGPMLPMWTFAGGASAQTNGGATEQLWVVDVAGTVVIIDGESFPGTPVGSKDEIRDIVASLMFE